MRQTTEFYSKVYEYIIGQINCDFWQNYGMDREPVQDYEKIKFVLDTFKKEYGFQIKRIGLQNAFTEWLSGLPSVIDIEFRNHSILELAVKWGGIPENATESQEYKILENWFNFISVNFFKLCRRHKVEA